MGLLPGSAGLPLVVLKETGLDLDPSVELRVWDSSGHSRWFVVPQRPAGTDGMTEAELAALVTTESMIGIAGVPAPAA
ncbi:nitrile hydratase subunit alpha [Streptomyces sp. NPDC005476]|uniref:nitrile hydratase subunit alpha n=1 Tax=Streptomyces sp. NPDC005476 TaxID=3156882 RepID=UPI003453A50C